MEKIQFDSGVQEFQFPNGILRFNPCDPNLYSRFLEAAEQIQALETELNEKARRSREDTDSGKLAVALMVEADGRMKAILQQVFGQENDFHKLLGGVNLLAVGNNGQRVITNLFDVLEPILVSGAQSCARQKTQEAVQKAKQRRSGK